MYPHARFEGVCMSSNSIHVNLDNAAAKYGWMYLVWVLSQDPEYTDELMKDLKLPYMIGLKNKHAVDIILKEIYGRK